MAKASIFNRVCFWLPKPWRVRLLNLIRVSDGRKQGEWIRNHVIAEIERAEAALAAIRASEKK